MNWLSGKALAASLIGALVALAVPSTLLAQQKRTITVGLPLPAMQSSFCMLPMAEQMGLTAAEGLEIKVQLVGASANALQATLAGRLDIGMATPEPVFKAVSENADIVMFYNFGRLPTGKIGVLESGPIKTLEDLKGKKLGASTLGAGNIPLTKGILSSANIDPNSVTYLAVGIGAQALQALISGHVDGLIVADTWFSQMENSGVKFRYLDGPKPNRLFGTSVVAKPSTLNSDPELARKFGRVLAAGTTAAAANPEGCIRAFWNKYPEARAQGVPEQQQMANELHILTSRLPLLVTPDVKTGGWGHFPAADVDDWNAFAGANGIISKPLPDPSKVYTNAYVADFNKFDSKDVEAKAKAFVAK